MLNLKWEHPDGFFIKKNYSSLGKLKRHMKKTILFFLLAFTVHCSFGQTDPQYQRSLKQLLQVSGTEASFTTVVTQMMTVIRQNYTNVPASVWNDFEQEVLKTSLDDLVEMLVPVYQKHLSQEDLVSLIAFYQTPAGKRYAEKTPMIMQESMQVGQQWGLQIAQRMQQKFMEKGY